MLLSSHTAKNTDISPNFQFWKFCGKAQFLHSFERRTQNYAKTVPFPQNFDTRKLGEIAVFYVMSWKKNCYAFPPFSLIGTILGKIRTGAK